MLAVPSTRGQATLRYCLRAPFLASGEMDPSLAQCLLARGHPSPKGSVHTFPKSSCVVVPPPPCCMHVTLYSQSIALGPTTLLSSGWGGVLVGRWQGLDSVLLTWYLSQGHLWRQERGH